ncbi:MAG: hypothetical protein ABIN95_09165, partial [Mucilaginibacter sp.]
MIKNACFIFVTSMACLPVYGQQYKTADIIKKADSLMIAVVGDSIFHKCYKYDPQSYYEYITSSGKINYKELISAKQTKRDFLKAGVRYTFCLDEYNKPCTNASVNFDNMLNLISPIDIAYVPEYLLNSKDCDILSRLKALDIGLRLLNKPGIRAIMPDLEYDYQYKTYVWKISNVRYEYQNWYFKDKTNGLAEVLILNAYTG